MVSNTMRHPIRSRHPMFFVKGPVVILQADFLLQFGDGVLNPL